MMYCFYDACDNNITKFHPDAESDCILQHLSSISKHYLAMKVKTDEAVKGRMRFEEKYKKEKEKNQMLKQKVPKTEKRLDALADTSKNRHQKNALKCVSPNLFEPNTSDIDPNFSPAVKMFKSRGQPAKVKEKENSFNKHSSVELSFLRVEQVFKDLPKKPLTKNLKQQKISFGKANGSSTSDNVKAISKVETEDSDATFCEEIERKKATKRPAWQPKIIIKELKKSTPSVEKKSRITEKVNDGLFNFTLPPTPVLRSISTTQLPNEQKASPKVAIKQEPFTCGSDPDIFSASEDEPSNGSSVIYVEASERNKEPIIIPDRTVHSDDYINEELEKEFAQRTEYDDPSELIETKPARKRARKYGECTNCREFYDKYAELNGPTEADDAFVYKCTQRCRGYQVRRKNSEAPPIPTHGPPPTNGETPEGFWDIPSTLMARSSKKSLFDHDDSDRTQDGF